MIIRWLSQQVYLDELNEVKAMKPKIKAWADQIQENKAFGQMQTASMKKT